MWALDNQTPYSAERTFVRDRDGAEIWLVAVRATYDLFPDGSLQIAKNQIPVAQSPRYLGKPGASSLCWDSDFPRTKLGTDVLVNATAHVPENLPDQKQLSVAIEVGALTKRLSVWGDRVWDRTLGVLHPTAPTPFRTKPIIYENTVGGGAGESTPRQAVLACNQNPVGRGAIAAAGKSLPNVAHADQLPEQITAKQPIPGFGAIGCSWSPRRELAGTYDQIWRQTRQPLVPSDFDDRYFQAAPSDQVASGFLTGGEQVELTNLTPSGYLRFQIPRLRFGFRTSINGTVEHHRANLHTVIIEPDARRLIMVWHSALPCHFTLYKLRQTVVFEKRRLDDREVAA